MFSLKSILHLNIYKLKKKQKRVWAIARKSLGIWLGLQVQARTYRLDLYFFIFFKRTNDLLSTFIF